MEKAISPIRQLLLWCRTATLKLFAVIRGSRVRETWLFGIRRVTRQVITDLFNITLIKKLSIIAFIPFKIFIKTVKI
ncbi:hypothetical protein A3E89_01415 [Candidatus Campbellbacteria bacterium RIFCSPHIGHO2_12_FULL_35_10]|uniref:Uncharacterized protein n=1 Tax=Candidatus Campbellbacteria bacterium RIFCSPHIGHO2_12_FULL_35_10 TaxID=1797578 RepID=A0A1F5EMT4_9BACT|nr:MAG: hypothetical protein A3E89_01415 [Candidatus Campbellbacteria bacterium RIFCSPHIGHO2_12_FULL_35_10]